MREMELKWIEGKIETLVFKSPKLPIETLGARLVIDFKNCCLKLCENCSLNNVVEIRIFSVYKTKNVFGIMV